MFAGNKSEKDYEKKLFETRVAVLRDSLETIAKMDYKKENAVSGNGEVDYELVARMVKTQARLALDIDSNLENKKETKHE